MNMQYADMPYAFFAAIAFLIVLTLLALWKPKPWLRFVMMQNKVFMRILGIKRLPKIWRLIGIDESNNMLPDAEKRYRIVICLFILFFVVLLYRMPF